MKNFKITSLITSLMTSLTLILTLLCGQSVWASLGDNESSVQDDVKSLNAQELSSTPGSQYTVHEIKTGGTTIREFVSAQGKIFGVAWRGPVHPDLQVLLGSHYGEYQTSAAAASKKGHGPTLIKNSDLKFERSGHMRDLRGRAVLSSMVPQGVSESVVQ